MGNLFVRIYDYFERRRTTLWLLLVALVALMATLALRVRYVEDINSFFPSQDQNISLIFENLTIKDKIAVMFTTLDDDPYAAMDAADHFAQLLAEDSDFGDNGEYNVGVDDRLIESMTDFVYGHLPLFMDDAAFERLDSLTSQRAIEAQMSANYQSLLSPMGGYISDFIFMDPLSLGGDALRAFQQLGGAFKYKIIDDYIFSDDSRTLLSYITPNSDARSRYDNRLVDAIESALASVSESHPDVDIQYFGAPAVAIYNARQIKRDSVLTLSIALLVIVLFISLAFKNRYTIFLVLTPALFGALFALSIISMVSGTISLIAVGAGSIIFGIALSYSIHILAHTNHCPDVRQMIRELAYPLTVGSFTTIGAFAGLTFTDSMLLQDFGLFSALTLVGTTIFALVFLPHMVSTSSSENSQSALLTFVNRVSNLHLDRSKLLIATLVVAAIGCGMFAGRVGFDSNMMNLNFMPKHLAGGEERLGSMTKSDDGAVTTLFIASGVEDEDAAKSYLSLCEQLDSLVCVGAVSSYSSLSNFVIPLDEQHHRLDRWREFWDEARIRTVVESINVEAAKLGFEAGAFEPFTQRIVAADFGELSYGRNGDMVGLFPDWISSSDELTSFIAQVNMPEESKAQIYDDLSTIDGVIAADRSFFASRMAEDVRDNFNLILYISSLLIFLALLLSYGRFELALLSFMPMAVSWVMILGIMYLLGIEFNIVSIILSTFIFGIGDDFSIFMMDGLINQYRDRSEVLSHHRVAIFFSAFTVIVGMGVLIFAKHPAMHSLGLISLIGILVVVAVTYTLQPLLFRFFIMNPARRGNFPWTIVSMLNSIYTYSMFVGGCFGIQGLMVLLHLVPIGRRRRKYAVHCLVSGFAWLFIKLLITMKLVKRNVELVDLKRPSVVIANHQSFIDILILLSLQPKMVMVTNGWVWNSPFFGRIVRYLEFFNTQEGYEKLATSLQEKIDDGYSVVIFPEGTRSKDSSVGRFHKGAFYLAEIMKLDIVPVMMYGNSLVASKSQGLYPKRGVVTVEFLPRIAHDDMSYGEGYKERTKSIARHFKSEYHRLYEECSRASNPYFREAIIKNYIYKDPVLEWYMRIKLSMERWYDHYDRLVPRKGVIVDLGCGYGAMSYMLSMLSSERELVAMDYDEQKIKVAQNAFLKSDRINFYADDIRTFESPNADAFIISDVLHYLDRESQELVVRRCVERLNEGGIIVIRDGDSSSVEQHVETAKTEKWSTEIIKFNKTDGPLCFLSRESLGELARQNGLSIQIVECDSKTSNTLFLLKRE